MKQEFQISEDEYAAATRLASRSKWNVLVPLLAVIAFPVVVGLIEGGVDTELMQLTFVYGVLIGLYVALRYFVIRPRMRRRDYRQTKTASEPVSVELCDDGLAWSSGANSGKLTWSDILKWREDSKFVLLFLGPRLLHIVPKRISQSGFDFDQMRSKLTEAIGPAA